MPSKETIAEVSDLHVGYVGVDSGVILITDPAYLGDGFPYERVRDELDEEAPANEIKVLGAAPGILSHTGVGDGLFPVYARLTSEGDFLSLTIDFSEHL